MVVESEERTATINGELAHFIGNELIEVFSITRDQREVDERRLCQNKLTRFDGCCCNEPLAFSWDILDGEERHPGVCQYYG
jgi:hypothetical protein